MPQTTTRMNQPIYNNPNVGQVYKTTGSTVPYPTAGPTPTPKAYQAPVPVAQQQKAPTVTNKVTGAGPSIGTQITNWLSSLFGKKSSW